MALGKLEWKRSGFSFFKLFFIFATKFNSLRIKRIG